MNIDGILARCLTGAIIMSAWACGDGGEGVRPEPAVDLEKVDPSSEEVVFWYQHTSARADTLLEMIADYNRINDFGITVRGEYMGNYGDIYRKMFVALQGGHLPAVVVAYQNQAAAYYRADGIVDLAGYMASPRWGLGPEANDDFFAAFLSQDRLSGVQMGLAPNRSMELLYFNVDWLQELGYAAPPRTWESFAMMCRHAREQPFSRSENTERSLGFLFDPDASRLASMIYGLGGTLMNASRTTYTLHTTEAVHALSVMQELMREEAVELLTVRNGDTQEFALGSILFSIGSSSGLPFFRTAVEEGLDFAWSVAPLPFMGEAPVINIYGASVSICRTTPEEQLAAWLFVKWFTEPHQQARWARVSNYFPVRKSAAGALEPYFVENPNYHIAFGLLKYEARSEPVVEGYQHVRELVTRAMVDIAEGEDLGEVLPALEVAANATLRQ